MPERPFLTAHWSDLLLLNFPVPVAAIERIAPPGTEPDLHDGQCYISIVGFRFHAVRLFGLPIPGHTRFAEINLRYYVRRIVGNETRRGVVFAREIVPRRAVALTANWLYSENYITRPMRSLVHMAGPSLAPSDTIEYAWRTRIPFHNTRWNRLAGHLAAPLALPAPNSLEEFIVEHYWGYVRARDGTTREYRVAHDPWRTAPASDVTWDCDVADFSRPRRWGGARGAVLAPIAEYLAAPPTSAVIAAGSPIQLYRGHRV
jgi:uncharacterized protein YqjF (DUF2071 family)